MVERYERARELVALACGSQQAEAPLAMCVVHGHAATTALPMLWDGQQLLLLVTSMASESAPYARGGKARRGAKKLHTVASLRAACPGLGPESLNSLTGDYMDDDRPIFALCLQPGFSLSATLSEERLSARLIRTPLSVRIGLVQYLTQLQLALQSITIVATSYLAFQSLY